MLKNSLTLRYDNYKQFLEAYGNAKEAFCTTLEHSRNYIQGQQAPLSWHTTLDLGKLVIHDALICDLSYDAPSAPDPLWHHYPVWALNLSWYSKSVGTSTVEVKESTNLLDLAKEVSCNK